MDIATIIGILSGIACIVIPIITGPAPTFFADSMSVIIVVGGGLASTLISFRLSEVITIFRVLKNTFTERKKDTAETILLLLDYSKCARRDGLLALENKIVNTEDKFVSKSIQFIVDGLEPDVVTSLLDMDIQNMVERHQRGQALFKTMGSLFPAWGMIGTLIGLIALLAELDDPSTIGASMAIALVTTLYGSVLANLFCIPAANKLAKNSKEELTQKEMIIEGILSIQAGENPRILEQRLLNFLSEKEKQRYMALAVQQEDVTAETLSQY